MNPDPLRMNGKVYKVSDGTETYLIVAHSAAGALERWHDTADYGDAEAPEITTSVADDIDLGCYSYLPTEFRRC